MKGATVRVSSGDHVDETRISFHAASCPRAARVPPYVLANVSTTRRFVCPRLPAPDVCPRPVKPIKW